MELVIARMWSTLTASSGSNDDDDVVSCEVRLTFRGICASPSSLLIYGGQRISDAVRLESLLQPVVDVSPVAKLDKWLTTIYPNNKGVVSPLGERDYLLLLIIKTVAITV